MVTLLLPLLFILNLDPSQALAKPGPGRPTVKQAILKIEQRLKIIWLTYHFLTKKDQAMVLSAILPPYLEALFRSTKPEKNTKLKTIMPYPRMG